MISKPEQISDPIETFLLRVSLDQINGILHWRILLNEIVKAFPVDLSPTSLVSIFDRSPERALSFAGLLLIWNRTNYHATLHR